MFAEMVQDIAAQALGNQQGGRIVGATGSRGKPLDDGPGEARLADIEMQGPQRPKCAQLRVPIPKLFGQLERMRQRRFAPFDRPHRHAERQAQREMEPHAQRIAQLHIGLEMPERALGALGAVGEHRRMHPRGRAVRGQDHTDCRVPRGRERPVERRPILSISRAKRAIASAEGCSCEPSSANPKRSRKTSAWHARGVAGLAGFDQFFERVRADRIEQAPAAGRLRRIAHHQRFVDEIC